MWSNVRELAKWGIGALIVWGIVIAILFATSGCKNVEHALKVAEESREQMELAGAEMRAAYAALDTARDAYLDAIERADQDNPEHERQIAAALTALQEAEREARDRELKFEETEKAFDNAARRLEEAKAEGYYLETLFGLVIGGIVGGGSGFLTGKSRRPKAGSPGKQD